MLVVMIRNDDRFFFALNVATAAPQILTKNFTNAYSFFLALELSLAPTTEVSNVSAG